MWCFIIARLAAVAFFSSCIGLVSSDDAPPLWNYWVDDSCTQYNIAASINEAQEMAKLAAASISDGTNSRAADYWNMLFKTDRVLLPAGESDPNYPNQKAVKEMFESISTAVGTDTRSSARTRFYCDEDGNYGEAGARWQLTPDIPGVRLPNSQRKMGYQQEWVDVVNHIRSDIDWTPCGFEVSDSSDGSDPDDVDDSDGPAESVGSLNDRSESDQDQQALTNGEKLQAGVWPDEVEPRFITTLCNSILGKGKFATLADIVPNADYSSLGVGISTFSTVASSVILHEWTHSVPIGDEAYGWRDCFGLEHEKAIKNADSLMFMGVLSKLADQGWEVLVQGNVVNDGRLVQIAAQQQVVIGPPPTKKYRRDMQCTVDNSQGKMCQTFNA